MPGFKRMPRVAAVAVLLCTAAPAVAGPFVSGGYANSATKYRDVKAGNGYFASLGYQLKPVSVFLEAEYFDSGKMDIEQTPDDLQYHGGQAFIGYAIPSGAWWGWIKGGYYRYDGQYAGFSEKQQGFVLGGGFDWMFARTLGLRVDLAMPFGLDSEPGTGYDRSTELAIIKLGAVWRPFDGRRRPHREPRSYPEVPERVTTTPVLPLQTPPQPYVAPAEAAVQAPVASTPAFAAGPARLIAGGKLHDRPKTASPAVALKGASDALTLQQSTANGEGVWWYAVATDGSSGWVQEADLLH